MRYASIRASGNGLRSLVLGTALAAGLILASAPDPSIVHAADLPAAQGPARPDASMPKASHGDQRGTPVAPGDGARAPDAASPNAPAAGAPANADAETEGDAGDTEAEAAARGRGPDKNGAIIIDKGDRHIRIQGLGREREYDSFEQFVQDAPWLAGLVFLSVLLVFLVPLLIIVLLIWYKIRKNRLANETMLKLAERGAISPAAAIDAVASGNTAAAIAAVAPPSQPACEQVRRVRARTAWSDLRKGVVLSGVGLGLAFYSMLDDGTPNGLGLVFLFVGLGYCLLWFVEDRTGGPSRDPKEPPPSGGA